MSSLRVVLYGEGGKDIGGIGPPLAPGSPLNDDDLGPAHWLIRRAIERARRIPEAAVHFEEGLRLARGHRPRGGAFLERENLRRLCTWASPRRAPGLAVILVDADDEVARGARLRGYLEGIPVPTIVGLAVREFESWLVADSKAATDACGSRCNVDGDIEALERREAKTRLETSISNQSQRSDRDVRISIARTCDLDVVAKRCPHFGELLASLAI